MQSKRLFALLTMAVVGVGCLARPLGREEPSTKVNFLNDVTQQAVDKIDLLFAIDNSASMGDKQAILKEAVPNLIEGLVAPPCVDAATRLALDGGKTKANPSGGKKDNYGCPEGSEPAFKPITDMHIGILSSSLGSMGGDVCPVGTDALRRDDNAKLLDSLAWYPDNEENKDTKRHPVPTGGGVRTLDQLIPSFQDMVVGVGQAGCGLEAQLESVYRFLIQPDPWLSIPNPNGKQAAFADGIDVSILKQRAEFLRPDSLVAIIMLTDEDDSSADPLAVNGFGYAYMSKRFPTSEVNRSAGGGTTAPRGTSACDTDPGSEDCTSCIFGRDCDPNDATCRKIRQDPSCTKSPVAGKSGPGFDGFYAPDDDNVNVRFHRMKERYGVDPQYPIRRYVDGLTKPRVPDRATEHPEQIGGDGRRFISEYKGDPKCTNPLFAAKLPTEAGDETCLLPKGPRGPNLVFFAVVGGVPNGLLHFDPNGTAEKNALSPDDWVQIIGKNPDAYDFRGIDPHMIQSVDPRKDLRVAGNPDSPRGDNGLDKTHGREWNTRGADLQYACTFALPEERPCDATLDACDCTNDSSGSGKPAGNAPLCKEDGAATQTRAKAYPSTRELRVVHALGDHGIAASLCPIQLADKEAATYGYKPAVSAIIDRLSIELITQCLPQPLRTDAERAMPELPKAPCLVLVQLDPASGQTCANLELEVPPADLLKIFREQQAKILGEADEREVCTLTQKTVPVGQTCAKERVLEWCYVEKAPGQPSPAGKCPQAVVLADGTSTLPNARFSLQCINQFSAAANGANQDDN